MNINEYKRLTGIKYFLKNTSNVGITKLFKLLYFWDFIHFKKFGMSVTCYEYYTYTFGPVPEKLYTEIINDKIPKSYRNEFTFIKIDKDDDEFDDKSPRYRFLLKNNTINYEWLSPNEKNILEMVAFEFKNATANQMTEITHLKNSPWDKTKEKYGLGHPIDYFLAIDDETTLDIDQIKEYFTLQKELCQNARL
jgi:uncharacterized phage-associated protein